MITTKTYPNKDFRTFTLEICQRELEAIQRGQVDQQFIEYALRQIRRALATS